MTRHNPDRRPERARAKADPHDRLLNGLLAMAGPQANILSASSRPWASATFQGSRHDIVLHFTGGDAASECAAMAAKAPDADFVIAGHIVADLSVDGREMALDANGRAYALLSLSVLVVEDW